MLLEIVAPHVLPILQIIGYGGSRFWDRSCSRDQHKTKCELQSQYEQMYIGPEFMIDSRLAQIIACTWVTFMFSSSMPGLYLVTAINFFIIYWVDKYLLLRFYKSPKNYDETTIMYTISMLKWLFVMHFGMGLMMLSNKQILKGRSTELKDEIEWYNDLQEGLLSGALELKGRFKTTHMVLFIVG